MTEIPISALSFQMLNYTVSVELRMLVPLSEHSKKKYPSHVVRMPNERAIKQPMFNDDRGRRPTKTLPEQVICSENVTLDQFCNLSMAESFEDCL